MIHRLLAIDTATPACSVALFENHRLIANNYQEIGRGHAEKLVPMIAELPGKGRAGTIFVNCGPGSFTGVRIGISTAKALAFAWKTDLRGYQCLHMVAVRALSKMDKLNPLCVAMAAGHGEFFVQNFSEDGVPVDELESLDPQRALDKVKSNLVAGSGAATLCDLTNDYLEATHGLPDAACANLLNQDLMNLNLSPIYGREPDAVKLHSQ